MHISPMEEYGLRCALQLAKESLTNGLSLSASLVAEREGISVEYVSKFMHLFKKAGLVASIRGVQGGFRLAQSPSATSLKQVFDALKGTPKKETVVESGASGFCGQFAGKNSTCVHIQQCSVRPFWSVLSYYFDEVTRGLTLGDLLRQEQDAHDRIHTIVDEKVKKLRKVYEHVV